jgi:hypothetical protein
MSDDVTGFVGSIPKHATAGLRLSPLPTNAEHTARPVALADLERLSTTRSGDPPAEDGRQLWGKSEGYHGARGTRGVRALRVPCGPSDHRVDATFWDGISRRPTAHIPSSGAV